MKGYNAVFTASSHEFDGKPIPRKCMVAGRDKQDAAQSLESNYKNITGLTLVEIEKEEEEKK